jgi:hypothetical protein
MPRISICQNLADQHKPDFSGENYSYDFCKSCYAKVDVPALAAEDGVVDDLEDAVEMDADHFLYAEEGRGDEVFCHKCRKQLTARDE